MSSNKVVVNGSLEFEVSDMCADSIIEFCKKNNLNKKRYMEITGCSQCTHLRYEQFKGYKCNITNSTIYNICNYFHINCPLPVVEE